MKTNLKFLGLALAFGLLSFTPKNPGEPEKIKIVIDAGHGGLDFGAQHEGYSEKEIVSALTEKIRKQCEGRDIELYLTREGDDFVKLSDRTSKINNLSPDLVISLHVNASATPGKSGTEIFIGTDSAHKEKSKQIASALGETFIRELNRPVEKIQEAPFHILKKSDAPALIVELGYVTNAHDLEFITEESSQNRIASVLTDFIDQIEIK